MNHQQKALRLAKTMKNKKSKSEKKELAHLLCEYCVALLADGYRKIGGGKHGR